MPLPSGVREDLIRQKNRVPLQQGLALSPYDFLNMGNTQQQLRNHAYSTLEWEVKKY